MNNNEYVQMRRRQRISQLMVTGKSFTDKDALLLALKQLKDIPGGALTPYEVKVVINGYW